MADEQRAARIDRLQDSTRGTMGEIRRLIRGTDSTSTEASLLNVAHSLFAAAGAVLFSVRQLEREEAERRGETTEAEGSSPAPDE